MLTKKQARQIIKNGLPSTMDICDKYTIEKEYGWVFFSQSKKYIESENILYMAVGYGGTLIEKATGKICKFGSAFPTEENLKIYELGYFKYDYWDIVIDRVCDPAKTVEYLSKLDIRYVIPEEAYGEVWRIPKRYTNIQLKKKLQEFPVRFLIGNIYFQYQIVESFKQQNTFTYKLEENKGYRNTL